MSKITPKQLLEAITSQAFKDVDLSPVLSLSGDELRTFTLEQMERLRAWPQCMAEAIKGPKQDNSSYLWMAVRKTEANAESTKVHFRIYLANNDCFSIPKDSYLEANGKRYKLTGADGIKLDVDNKPEVNTFGIINYTDFTLTFEPFDTLPATYTFKKGNTEDAPAIRNISLK